MLSFFSSYSTIYSYFNGICKFKIEQVVSVVWRLEYSLLSLFSSTENMSKFLYNGKVLHML